MLLCACANRPIYRRTRCGSSEVNSVHARKLETQLRYVGGKSDPMASVHNPGVSALSQVCQLKSRMLPDVYVVLSRTWGLRFDSAKLVEHSMW
jgi:hypothetical protein